MSGIAGILRLSRGSVDESSVRMMIDRLAHRGGDECSVWHEETIGIAQCLRSFSHEPPRESRSLNRVESGLRLVADARIDNRDELINILFRRQTQIDSISDEALILAAYDRWETSCASHLIGDFAFAIWDEQKKRLYCARDFAGVKPFYYCSIPNRQFLFASEIKALLLIKEVPRNINYDRLADYVAQITTSHTYTFFKHIERLPAGHFLTVNRDGLKLERYFLFDSEREIDLGSNEDFAAAFQQIFTESVECRLSQRAAVASTLSGGLDSSSVTGVASESLHRKYGRRLNTFSAVFDEVATCDERDFIKATIGKIDVASHFIPGDNQHPLGDLNEMLMVQDEPFTAPNAAMMWNVYKAIKSADCDILLSGHGGDETISHGIGLLKELATSRQWMELYRQLRGLGKLSNQFIGKIYLSYLRYGIAPRQPTTIIERVHGKAWRMLGPLVSGNADSVSSKFFHPVHLLQPDIRSETRIDERLAHWHKTQPHSAETERERHLKIMTDPLQQNALEVLDRMTNAHGFEIRFPFWDQRIAEYCLSLPAAQKLDRGLDRLILRCAMKDVLPEQVRLRTDKTDFSENLMHGLQNNDGLYLNELESELNEVEDLVQVSAVRDIIVGTQKGTASTPEMGTLLNVASLVRWRRLHKIA